MPALLDRLASAAYTALCVALLAACSDAHDGDVVELRRNAPALQALYSYMIDRDNVEIRLHLYDRPATSEGLGAGTVYSKEYIAFDIPRRAIMTNIISGPGDKRLLAAHLFLVDGEIAPVGGAPPDTDRQLMNFSVDSVSRSTLRFYRENPFLMLTDLRSIAVPSVRGLRCRRGDGKCVSRLTARLHDAKKYCGFSVLEYQSGYSQTRPRSEASFPFSEGNVFIRPDEWPEKPFFLACLRNPVSTTCRWHGLYEGTYPISISLSSKDICEQVEVRDKVIDWLKGHVVN